MFSIYLGGIALSLMVLIFQIKAALEVKSCSKTLPTIWAAFALSALLFMIDKILVGDALYAVYFAANAIIMWIASVIVWKKSQ